MCKQRAHITLFYALISPLPHCEHLARALTRGQHAAHRRRIDDMERAATAAETRRDEAAAACERLQVNAQWGLFNMI